MSYRDLQWAMYESPMPYTPGGKPDTVARFVLWYLALEADNSGTAHVPVSRIQHHTGLADQAIRRALRRLQDTGTIQPCGNAWSIPAISAQGGGR